MEAVMAVDLGKQIGPLPMGAWVVVVGAGLGIAYYTRSNSASASASTADTGNALDTTNGVSPLDTVGDGSVGGWTQTTPDTTGDVAGPITDNDGWGRVAINYLIATGYDPALSQSAIGHALQGTAMSIREYTLWGIALAHLGAPPYPVDVVPPVSVPGPTKPTPTPPRTAPRSRGHFYMTKPGDTLHIVSRKAYGTPSRWDDIRRANAVGAKRPQPHPNGWVKTHNPDAHIGVGRWLWIPPR